MNHNLRIFASTGGLRYAALAVASVLLLASCGQGRDTPSSLHPMPTYNGRNGVLSYGLGFEWTKNTSLKDWTLKTEFVVEGHVSGQTLYDPPPPASQDTKDPVKTWNSLRHVTIDQVLWQRPNGIKAPRTIDFLDAGWVTDDDGKAYPSVPDEGVRLDVGDRFVAAIVNVQNIYPAAVQQTEQYKLMPSHWSTLDPGAVLLVEEGKIVTDRRTPRYERGLTGLTVDEFAERIRGGE